MQRLTLLSALVLATLPTAAIAQAPPTVVRAATVELREVQDHHRVAGSLRAVSRGDVSALEEGRIVEVTVREGAQVKEGEVIARLDKRRLDAQKSEVTAALRAAQALVEQRQLELVQAKRDVERSKQLIQSRAMTVEEHQHRETSAAVAQAQLATDERRVAEVESQLELLNVRLEDMVVRAPYDGRVVTRYAEPGEWIRAGEPFVTLVSTGSIEAWLDVPERFAQSLGDGQLRVDVLGFDRPLNSVAVKRVPDVDARTRTFPVVLTFNDEGGRLTPGMSVDAWLPIGDRAPRLTAPKDAVIRSGRTAYVYKAVDRNGATVAQQAPVVVAFETGGSVVLSGGDVAEGDRVVVEGNERLLPGTEIVVSMPPDGRAQDDRQYAARER